MLRYAALAVALVALAGCKHTPDDCEVAYDRMAPLMEKVVGRSLRPNDRASSLADCRANVAAGKPDPVMACVLPATTDDATRACMDAAVQGGLPARKVEARVLLGRVQRGGKAAYIAQGSYPAGSAATLPAQPCCQGPDHRCPADAAAFAADPVWKALELAPTERLQFQYSYTSDGRTVVATAVGDPDCDGKPVTYTLNMAFDGKNPTARITP
jgi:hypothetical protein